jgi:hypothetical protein
MESILGGNAQSNLVDQMKTAPKDKSLVMVKWKKGKTHWFFMIGIR